MKNCKLINSGGFWLRSAAYATDYRNIAIGQSLITGQASAQISSCIVINGDQLELGLLDNNTSQNTTYDVWVKYVKN